MKKTLEARETRLHSDDFKGWPQCVRRRVDRPGDEAIRLCEINHKGPEVGYIGHNIKGHLLGNSLVLAKLIVGVSILLPESGIGRVQESSPLEGKTQGTRLLLDFCDGTQQG